MGEQPGAVLDSPAVHGPVPGWLAAEHLLHLRRGLGLSTTNFELLKLLYFAHGWLLGLRGRPLIQDSVLAWELGPVVPEVYYRYRHFGAKPIDSSTVDMEEFLDEEQAWVINGVAESYKKKTFGELFGIAHHPLTPWYRVFHNEGRNAIIPDELTREHYEKLAAGG